MNIAFYAPLKSPDHETPSGDRRMARLLMAALGAAGHTPHLASRLRSHDLTGAADRQAHIRRAGGAEADALIARYRALPRTQAPDIWFTYHLYHKAPDWLGPPVAAALDIPYIVAEASLAGKHAGGPWAEGHDACVAAVARAAAVLSLNRDDDPAILPCLGDARRLIPLKPFLDPAPYRAARDKAGRAGAACRLLAVAMMRHGDKLASYEALAAALARLLDRPWHLTLVGDGPARDAVEAAFAGIGADRVTFAGACAEADLPCFYAAAEIYVWPAVNEAYGMALLEAQAAGLAVVAGRVRGVPGIVSHGETGLLVAESEDFAAVLGGLMDDPLRRAALGAAAAANVIARHGMDGAAATLDDALKLGRRP